MTPPTSPVPPLDEARTAPDTLDCVPFKMGKVTGRLMFGGDVYTIRGETGNTFAFEWHPYCGPLRCSATTGEPIQAHWPKNSAFWDLLDRWIAGGKKVDSFGRCILTPVAPR